jgi:hypothetical protein
MEDSGRVVAVRDEGTIWQIIYTKRNGWRGVVNMDHRCFSQMYEFLTGSSFFEVYRFGAGTGDIEAYFKGRTIHVEGEPIDQRVWLED